MPFFSIWIFLFENKHLNKIQTNNNGKIRIFIIEIDYGNNELQPILGIHNLIFTILKQLVIPLQ